MEKMLVPHRGEGGTVGKLADPAAREAKDSRPKRPLSPEAKLAETRQRLCFQTDPYSVGDRGLHPVDRPSPKNDAIFLPRWLAHGDTVARRVEAAPEGERDAALLDYFKHRKTHGQTIHRTFGAPGMELATNRYAEPAHRNAIEWLRRRLADPSFAPGLTPLERAEIELLAAHPQDFVSCTARRERPAQT